MWFYSDFWKGAGRLFCLKEVDEKNRSETTRNLNEVATTKSNSRMRKNHQLTSSHRETGFRPSCWLTWPTGFHSSQNKQTKKSSGILKTDRNTLSSSNPPGETKILKINIGIFIFEVFEADLRTSKLKIVWERERENNLQFFH